MRMAVCVIALTLYVIFVDKQNTFYLIMWFITWLVGLLLDISEADVRSIKKDN